MANIETGVYHHPSGHTLVINENHPRDIGLAPGYERLASAEEFGEGRSHPYAMPGEEPADWTPEASVLGGGGTGGSTEGGLTRTEVDEIVDAAVEAAVKKALADADKKFQTALKAEVSKAVEAATK